MNRSPLSLERYFFSRLVLEAHAVTGELMDNGIQTELKVSQSATEPKLFQLLLQLQVMPPKTGQPAYTGEFHAVGFFRVADDWPEAQVLKLVQSDGAAILYGTIREMITNLTSRGPWPALVLPSVNFIPVEAGKPEAIAAARKTKPSRRTI